MEISDSVQPCGHKRSHHVEYSQGTASHDNATYHELLDWANNRKRQWLRERAKLNIQSTVQVEPCELPEETASSTAPKTDVDDWIASWYQPKSQRQKADTSTRKEESTFGNVITTKEAGTAVNITKKQGKIADIPPTDEVVKVSSLQSGKLAELQEGVTAIAERYSQQIPSTIPFTLIENSNTITLALKPLQACKVLAIDTETTGLDPHQHKIRLIQIAAPDMPVVIVDLFKVPFEDLAPLKELLSSSAIKVFHNAKFDLKFLKKSGLPVKGQLFDTMLASRLLTAGLPSQGHNLAELVKVYLGEELFKEQQTSNWSSQILSKEQLEYAARDAAILLRLRNTIKPKLSEARLIEAAKLEFDCLPAVVEMELNGMLLDLSCWETLRSCLEVAKDKAARELKLYLQAAPLGQLNLLGSESDINLNSQPQILQALQALHVPIKNTSRQALLPLASQYPVVKALLKYRKAAKSVQAFASSLPKYVNPVTGRIHADYQQLGAATGRTSCRNPNLQQIPRDKIFRSCFISAPGYKLVVADYSQIELRAAAEISGDRRMIAAYQNDEDLHQLTAAVVTGKSMEQVTEEERRAAKAINFGLIFAMSAASLADYAYQSYGVQMTLNQAVTFRKRFFQAYKGIAVWHESVKNLSPTEMRTLSHRRRQWQDKAKLTELYNTPVQGTAADIIKKALALLPNALLNTGAKIIGSVHDEILLEVPEAQAEVAAKVLRVTMEESGQLYLKRVPVKSQVSICQSWSQK